MRRITLILTLCSMAIVGCGNCFNSVPTAPLQECIKVCSIVGDWSGILDIGIMKITLVLHIQEGPEGALSATVDTLEQKIYGNPIDWIEFEEGVLKFEIKAAVAKFEGLLIKNESEISGQFIQAGQSFSLTFERGLKSVESLNCQRSITYFKVVRVDISKNMQKLKKQFLLQFSI